MLDLSLLFKIGYPEIFAEVQKYLDPGSGSFLLQILIATIAGAGIFIVASWRKVKAFFAGLFNKEQATDKSKKTKNG